jgi:GNAT superfamily N-acetyltransferase
MATCSPETLATFMDSYIPTLEKIIKTPVKWHFYQSLAQEALGPRLAEGGTWYLCDKALRPTITTIPQRNYAFFSIEQLRGCCGVCVSTGARVRVEYQWLGIGTLLNEMRLGMAKRLGYGVMLCTDALSNEPEVKILEKNGWKEMYNFVNPRTNRKLGIYLRTLDDIPMNGPVFAKGAPAAIATRTSLQKAGKL